MSDYEKNIDKIRKYFEEHKAELYPFENALLSEKDEYVKSLYFRMLCTLVRYTGEPSEMQVLYIRRLMAGSHAENEFQDYMKMALDLDTKDIHEFISIFKEDDLKYYFCIDGAILLSVAQGADKNYVLLAELVEMLKIAKNDLEYLMMVAKATLAQSSELFEEAKEHTTDTTESLSMYHYVCEFFNGAIIDTSSEIHVYSKDKSCEHISDYPTFKAKKVIIENITEDLKNDIEFKGCEEVIIKNCNLTGNRYNFIFTCVGKVVVENCRISDFHNRFMHLQHCNELIVSNNYFINCGNSEDDDCEGGVIYANYVESQIILKKNTLQNCYINTEYDFEDCYGLFIYAYCSEYGLFQVVDNHFIGCTSNQNTCYIYNGNEDCKVIDENNTVSGSSVTRICG